MSIIYDALKKVEKADIQGQTGPGLKTQAGAQKRNLKAYLLYAFFICAGLLMAGLFFNLLGKASVKPAPPSLAPLPQISTAAAAQIKPAEPQEEAKPQLELNGIFFSENKGYALINNRILSEGDVIEGATIVQIGAASVKLKFKDEDFTLAY